MLSQGIAGPNPSLGALTGARHEDPAGAPFQTLASGTQFTRNHAQARIVLEYATPGVAKQDLARREHALLHDWSFVSFKPYTDLLHLTRASAQGSDVLLDVTAVKGETLPLEDMWTRSDLAFARC